MSHDDAAHGLGDDFSRAISACDRVTLCKKEAGIAPPNHSAVERATAERLARAGELGEFKCMLCDTPFVHGDEVLQMMYNMTDSTSRTSMPEVYHYFRNYEMDVVGQDLLGFQPCDDAEITMTSAVSWDHCIRIYPVCARCAGTGRSDTARNRLPDLCYRILLVSQYWALKRLTRMFEDCHLVAAHSHEEMDQDLVHSSDGEACGGDCAPGDYSESEQDNTVSLPDPFLQPKKCKSARKLPEFEMVLAEDPE